MAIRYTVTTHTKSCPCCGEVLDEKVSGDTTPYSVFLLPVLIPYIVLNKLAFSSPEKIEVGAKYCYCPKCYTIISTGRRYLEELFGKSLLDYKFSNGFYIAYGVGSILMISLLYGLFTGFPTKCIITLIVCASILIGIIIAYRILLNKYRQQKELTPDMIDFVSKTKDQEYKNILFTVQKKKEQLTSGKSQLFHKALAQVGITDVEELMDQVVPNSKYQEIYRDYSEDRLELMLRQISFYEREAQVAALSVYYIRFVNGINNQD